MIEFSNPWFFALLIAWPLLAWPLRRSLADMTPAQRRTCLAIRALLLALIVFALAGIRALKNSDALAVIFVPMFFSSTPPKQENTTIGLNIPPAPERNFETRNLAVDAPGKATPAPAIPKTDVAPADKVTTVTTAAPASNEAARSPQKEPKNSAMQPGS